MMEMMTRNSRYSECGVEAGDLTVPWSISILFFKDSLSLSLELGISVRLAGPWALGICLHIGAGATCHNSAFLCVPGIQTQVHPLAGGFLSQPLVELSLK